MKKKDLTTIMMGLTLILQLIIVLINLFNLKRIDYEMIYSSEMKALSSLDQVMYLYASMSLYSLGLIINSVIFAFGCFIYYIYLKKGSVKAHHVCGLGLVSFITNPLGGILWFLIAANYQNQLNVMLWGQRLLIVSVILVGSAPILSMLSTYMILIEQPIISAHLSSFDSLLHGSVWTIWIKMVIDSHSESFIYIHYLLSIFQYFAALTLGLVTIFQKVGSKKWMVFIILTFIVQSFIMNIGALLTLAAIILVFVAQRQQSKKSYVLDYDI